MCKIEKSDGDVKKTVNCSSSSSSGSGSSSSSTSPDIILVVDGVQNAD